MPLAIPYTLVEEKVSKITNDIQKINLDLNITQFPERE